MAKVIHDWDLVKSEYVEGIVDRDGNLTFPTLHFLGQRHSISESTLRKKSASDDWTTEKNIYRTRLEQKRREEKIEVLARKASEFDATILRVAEIAVKHIQVHFIQANESFKKTTQPMSLNALGKMGRALQLYQQIGRTALGEPAENPGTGRGDESYELIREIIGDPAAANRIRENFRRKTGSSISEE